MLGSNILEHVIRCVFLLSNLLLYCWDVADCFIVVLAALFHVFFIGSFRVAIRLFLLFYRLVWWWDAVLVCFSKINKLVLIYANL